MLLCCWFMIVWLLLSLVSGFGSVWLRCEFMLVVRMMV